MHQPEVRTHFASAGLQDVICGRAGAKTEPLGRPQSAQLRTLGGANTKVCGG
jgi:hypothetical protein